MRVKIAENLWLEPRDLLSHVHGVGLSRTGKSKLIELIVRDLITKREPFCLIDPHGTLYNAILDWLCVMDFDRPITLFDPSRGSVGFNPFKADYTDPAQLMTKTERLVSATFIAWGITDTSTTPRLTKMLTCLYYLLVEQQLPLSTFDVFLDHRRKAERDAIIRNTKSDWVRQQMEKLSEKGSGGYEAYLESVDNKLRMFVHPQVRKVFDAPPMDLDRITREGMLLVNLQPSQDNIIGAESNAVLGTLLVNELWELTYKRDRPQPFFLVIDECHRYMTPDIGAMLAEGAKYGLHLMLFHQDRSQVKGFEGALKNAQTKISFSTEEGPMAQREFVFRKADHTAVRAVSLTVIGFPVARARREALIETLAPAMHEPVCEPIPEPEPAPIAEPKPLPVVDTIRLIDNVVLRPVSSAEEASWRPPPRVPVAPKPVAVDLGKMPILTYSKEPEELLAEFRYLTAEHLEALTGLSNKSIRNAMLKLKKLGTCQHETLDQKNVYCWKEKGKEHKHLLHELLITEFHLALYNAGVLRHWEQTGLKDPPINPDAYFTTDCPFFLEMENANPRYALGVSDWVKKAGQYQDYHDAHRTENFRVLFVVKTATKAHNLKVAIHQSGLPNLGKFWIADYSCFDFITEPVFITPRHDQRLSIGTVSNEPYT